MKISSHRWMLVIAVLLLGVCAASVYAMKWYHRFYHHVTTQELSHEVKHTTLVVTIRSDRALKLQLYQQEHAARQPLVLFTSGDGGWSPFCADVAAHIAATGKTVVGIDAKEYLVDFASPKKPLAPEEIASDYDSIAQLSLAQTGVDNKAPLVLAGWSLGAGYSAMVAAQPQFALQVSRVVAISLPAYCELAWKPSDAIIYITHGRPGEKAFDAHWYLQKLNQTPIVFLNATDDDTAPLSEAKSLYQTVSGAKHFYTVKASGHHFEGGQEEFYRDLDEGLATLQIAAAGP